MKAPATTTLVQRPPAGPARGLIPAPAWLVGAMTLALAVAAALSLTRAFRRGKK